MGNRYSIKDCREAMADLAAAKGVEVYSHDKHQGAATGKWALDHNSVYGGYVIREYANEGFGYRTPYGETRRGAREFVEFCNQIEGGILEGKRLARQEAERQAEQEANDRQWQLIFETQRDERADRAFETYDMDNLEVVGRDGWEKTTPGDEWTRKFYVEAQGPDSISEDGTEATGSQQETFVVRFVPGDIEVAEAYVSGW